MGLCATYNEKYICCMIHVIKTVQSCPYGCSYCFLQEYLTDTRPKIVADIKGVVEEVRQRVSKEPWRLFRVGTWELGDSLAFEHCFPQAKALVEAFADMPNLVLELKTKSALVDPILKARHKGKTVVSWSVNPERIISTEERGTASLRQRLKAMARTVDAGYLLGLHFDPMILYDGWQREYSELVEEIFSYVSAEAIAWISIGSLRFSPEMKRLIEINHPYSRITLQEMVKGDDGKMRYLKPLRVQMYSHLYDRLKRHITQDVPVYLCMERWDMWRRVLGNCPADRAEMEYMFAKNLFDRFGIGPEPQYELYRRNLSEEVFTCSYRV